MLRNWTWRFFVGLCFALPFGLAATAVARAEPPLQEPPGDDCLGCHEIIGTHWQASGHGRALSDPVFREAWQAQGSQQSCLQCHTTGFDPTAGTYQAEGVSCTMCHSPKAAGHPDEIMPTDISSRNCGQCHLDTYAEWQASTHGQEDLACVRCHNPHTADLKKSGAQELCQSCHNEEAHFFSYTLHADEGLLCTDCHLRVSGSQPGEGHGSRLHLFAVDIGTCTECHINEMHYPSDKALTAKEAGASDGEVPSLTRAEVYAEPSPVSPFGFAILAALIGMGSGMVLAPWLEGWYHRMRAND